MQSAIPGPKVEGSHFPAGPGAPDAIPAEVPGREIKACHCYRGGTGGKYRWVTKVDETLDASHLRKIGYTVYDAMGEPLQRGQHTSLNAFALWVSEDVTDHVKFNKRVLVGRSKVVRQE